MTWKREWLEHEAARMRRENADTIRKREVALDHWQARKAAEKQKQQLAAFLREQEAYRTMQPAKRRTTRFGHMRRWAPEVEDLLRQMWGQRDCFVCEQRGPCAHREPLVDLASVSAMMGRRA